jgi:hypothetical protein
MQAGIVELLMRVAFGQLSHKAQANQIIPQAQIRLYHYDILTGTTKKIF